MAQWVAPPGLVHKFFAAIASIIALQFIGSQASANNFAAASRALTVPSALAYLVFVALAGDVAIEDFALAGFLFGALVDLATTGFALFFADMVVLLYWRFASPSADVRWISGVATRHQEPCGWE